MRRLLAACALAGIVAAAYAPSLDVPFEFDDWHVIEQNPAVHDPAHIPSFFTDISTFSLLPGNRDYRPVFLTSMALAWAAGDGDTLPFHLVSLALHLANALLLASILGWLLARERDPAGGLPRRDAGRVGLGAALIFAVHPLASEATVYISSQSILLAAFFSLLSLRLFLASTGGRADRRWGPRLASWAAYSLALLSKPTAILLPGVLVLWELLFGRDAQHASGDKPTRRRRALRQLPYWAVTLGYLAWRSHTMGGGLSGGNVPWSRWVQTLTQTKALVFYYLKLALWPVGLNVDRDYPLSSSVLDPQVLVALFVLSGVAILLFRLRRYRNLVFWSLWFPAWLLLTTYGVALLQIVREGRAYLALAGICALAAIGFDRLLRFLRQRPNSGTLGPTVAVAIAGVLVLALAVGTHRRSQVWTSPVSLWGDAASSGGTWRAHMNYGLALEHVGRGDEALTALERAVELGPYAYAHLNLGLALMRRQRLDDGLGHLYRAVQLWPTLPEAHRYLAWGLERVGRDDDARRHLRRALELRPDDLATLWDLGSLLERQGELRAALVHYERLEVVDPGDPRVAAALDRLRTRHDGSVGNETFFLDAFAAQQAGERTVAIARYRDLLERDPDHRQGHFNLAYALMSSDRADDWRASVVHFERVLAIDPTYTEAWFHLGTLHRRLGQLDDAVAADRRYLQRGVHDDLLRRAAERLRGAAQERSGGR